MELYFKLKAEGKDSDPQVLDASLKTPFAEVAITGWQLVLHAPSDETRAMYTEGFSIITEDVDPSLIAQVKVAAAARPPIVVTKDVFNAWKARVRELAAVES